MILSIKSHLVQITEISASTRPKNRRALTARARLAGQSGGKGMGWRGNFITKAFLICFSLEAFSRLSYCGPCYWSGCSSFENHGRNFVTPGKVLFTEIRKR